MPVLPASCQRCASARPMPEPPPVTRMLLPLVFMALLLGGCVGGVVRQPRYVYALQRKEGTRKCHSYPKERIGFSAMPALEKIAYDPHAPVDPRVETLVNELIGRVADKWTLLVLEELEDHGTCRFTQLSRLVPGISQKMLTQTLRAMERDGLVVRTVHPVATPKVEYCLTDLGPWLGEAFCGVWIWAETNLDRIEKARSAFDSRG